MSPISKGVSDLLYNRDSQREVTLAGRWKICETLPRAWVHLLRSSRRRCLEQDSGLASAARVRQPTSCPLTRLMNVRIVAATAPHRGLIGNAVRDGYPNAATAPATVSGEFSAIGHWDQRVLGRRRTTATRKSGDLPSAVVTRDHIGRGVSMGLSSLPFGQRTPRSR